MNNTAGSGRNEGDGTTNGGMTTEEMAGETVQATDSEESADIDSNTLGGTSDSGAGPV